MPGMPFDERDDMLKLLKRWLGREEDLEYFSPEDFKPRARPTSATAHVLAGSPRKPPGKPAAPRGKPKPAATVKAAPPALNLDAAPEEPHFDPYNTGKFDRSASWERISKNQR